MRYRGVPGCWQVIAWALLVAHLDVSHALAYCRSSTDTEPSGLCEESSDSLFLTWARTCFTYSFYENTFERLQPLSEGEVRGIVQTSFDTWMDVDCGGDSFQVLQASDVTTSEPVEFVFDIPNTAVISAQTSEEWRALEQPPSAFAITFLWHNKKTGEIFDVDMALNLRHAPFLDCGTGCRGHGVDLQNTVTHEAGHLFGLGHSDVMDATMQFDARAGETFMRDLESDDRAGMCALSLPGLDCGGGECMCPPAPAIPAVVRTRRGCGIASGPSAGGALVLAALCLAGLAVRARRKKRVRREIVRT